MKWMSVLLGGLLLSGGVAEAVENRLDTGIHYRQENLDWSVGFGDATPNILSELTWEKVQSAYFSADHWTIFTPHVVPGSEDEDTPARSISAPLFRLWGGYGVTLSGENQDSDYAGNDRAGEWSRSNNDVNGDGSYDVSLASGWHYRSRPNRGTTWASSLLLGYSFHSQKFNMVDGRQTLSDQGVFDALVGQNPGDPGYAQLPPVGFQITDLDSSYTAKWDGPLAGLYLEHFMSDRAGNPRMRFWGAGYYRWSNYVGEGVWNLRGDLAQGPSFRHTAEARGVDLSAGVDYNLSPKFAMGVEAGYGKWSADENGLDQTFASSGWTSVIKLNEVSWDYLTLGVKFNWIY